MCKSYTCCVNETVSIRKKIIIQSVVIVKDILG